VRGSQLESAVLTHFGSMWASFAGGSSFAFWEGIFLILARFLSDGQSIATGVGSGSDRSEY
jgi:hypothetical protein